MDYEKLKEAKRLYKTANQDQKYVLESLFPELAESRDERIRKDLIRFVKGYIPDETSEQRSAYLAWLEKQGEHKPAWSEEDENICCTIINDIANDKSICKYEISKGVCDTQINWLKSLKDRLKGE